MEDLRVSCRSVNLHTCFQKHGENPMPCAWVCVAGIKSIVKAHTHRLLVPLSLYRLAQTRARRLVVNIGKVDALLVWVSATQEAGLVTRNPLYGGIERALLTSRVPANKSRWAVLLLVLEEIKKKEQWFLNKKGKKHREKGGINCIVKSRNASSVKSVG